VSVEQADVRRQLRDILALAQVERTGPLARLCERLDPLQIDGDLRPELIAALVEAIETEGGTAVERVVIGDCLGWMGDPRLRRPQHSDYWVALQSEDGASEIGRFPVTNDEFQAFVDAGGYADRRFWSDEGWAWLQTCSDPWPRRSAADDARPFVVPNQPVVGVSWHEAAAYAAWAGARLPRFDERTHAVRGDRKRPYPWGSPFGEGNANTREEVLGRPCAIGLYLGDRTPDGIIDLAGNVAEWAGDGAGDERWYAPGSWDQPSMAAWAKARELEQPQFRSSGLGFRLARDP
jgi:hypothetical protein